LQKHKQKQPHAWIMPKPLTPARICHSTVARMLGNVCKAESGSHSTRNHVADLVASDSVQEQLFPFDNLALDAETKVCSLCCLLWTR
jgi:hypothetical protein